MWRVFSLWHEHLVVMYKDLSIFSTTLLPFVVVFLWIKVDLVILMIIYYWLLQELTMWNCWLVYFFLSSYVFSSLFINICICCFVLKVFCCTICFYETSHFFLMWTVKLCLLKIYFYLKLIFLDNNLMLNCFIRNQSVS